MSDLPKLPVDERKRVWRLEDASSDRLRVRAVLSDWLEVVVAYCVSIREYADGNQD